MATPYTPPAAGTAVLFPPSSGVAEYDVDSGDLSAAANAIYFGDEARWPYDSGEGGSNLPLETWLVDCPDGADVANYLAITRTSFITGATVPTPDTDVAGTIPYVNPANSSDPDAIYALNWLLDHR